MTMQAISSLWESALPEWALLLNAIAVASPRKPYAILSCFPINQLQHAGYNYAYSLVPVATRLRIRVLSNVNTLYKESGTERTFSVL